MAAPVMGSRYCKRQDARSRERLYRLLSPSGGQKSQARRAHIPCSQPKQGKLDSCSHLPLLFRLLHSDGLERLEMLSQVGGDRTGLVGGDLLDYPRHTGSASLAIKLQESEHGMGSPGRIAFQERLLRLLIRDGRVANGHLQERGEDLRQLFTGEGLDRKS